MSDEPEASCPGDAGPLPGLAMQQAMQSVQASERRFRALYEDAPMAYQSLDVEGHLVEVNPAWCELFGYERQEVIGRNFAEFLAPAYTGVFQRNFPSFKAAGRISGVEFEMVRRDGSHFRVAAEGRIGYDEQGHFKQTHCVLTDVTEQRRAEAELRHTNRALQAISLCNQALFRAVDETSLLQDICRIAVDAGGYRFAWVALTRSDLAVSVYQAAHAGYEAGYLTSVSPDWRQYGPAAIAARTGQMRVVRDLLHDPSFARWRDQATKRGYASLIALPLVADGAHLGALAIYSDQPNIFDDAEIKLLSGLADDLAFGIATLRARAERARAEAQRDASIEAVRRERDIIRNIFESSPNAIIIVDVRGTITGCNHAAWKIAGCASAEAIVGQNVFEFVPRGYRSRTFRNIANALRNARQFDAECCMRTADGRQLPVEVSAGALRSAAGTPMGFVGIIRDLSERKRAEASLREAMEALQRSELKLRSLVEQSSDGIALTDRDGIVIEWNAALEQITGVAAADALGRPIWDVQAGLVPEERAMPARLDQWRRAIQSIMRDGGRRRRVRRAEVVRPDGQRRSLESTAFPIQTADGPLFGAIFRDVTEREQHEEAMRVSQKLESIGLLAGGIAHDFNNLLTGVLGQTTLALARLEPGHPVRANIEKAARSAERAADLTRQLLAYAGKGQFKIDTVDLNALIRENALLLDAALPKQVQLQLDLAPDLPGITADATQLQQVIMNLAINAAEASQSAAGDGSDRGQVTIRSAIRTVQAEDDAAHWVSTAVPLPGRYVCLQVEDAGIGMDEATLARIFDPFFTTKATGRGLGLPAVLGIVRAHRGGLGVVSRPGAGTVFTLLFPTAAEPPTRAERGPEPFLAGRPHEPEGPVASQGDSQAAAARSAKVLIVDDDAPVREALTDILELAGVGVVAVPNGQAALTAFSRQRGEIGLVLLDLVMPGMSGEETLRALRQIDPEVKVILSSGYDEAEAVERFTAPGTARPADFLQKPYSMQKVLAKVRAALALARPV